MWPNLLTPTLIYGAKTNNLTLGLFVSRSGSVVYEGVLPAVDLALDSINANSSILPDFVLDYDKDVIDSMCNAAPAVRGFVNSLFQTPTKIMIIGPDCSSSTQSVAELAQYWQLVQISFAATSIPLSDMERFPTFLRTIPSDAMVPQGVISVMKEFGWENIGVITQQEDAFTSVASSFQTLTATDIGINILRSSSFNTGSSPQTALRQLMLSGARIIFLNVNVDYAIDILCEAFYLRLPTGYVWITYGWYFNKFWEDPVSFGFSRNCTIEELGNIVEEMLFISTNSSNQDNMCKDIVGLASNATFDDEYHKYFRMTYGESSNVKLRLKEARLAYDAIWTAAKALDAAETILKADMQTSLVNFTYESENISKIILNNSLKQKFCGSSGFVEFDNTGSRVPYLHLQQLRSRERVSLATIMNNGSSLNFYNPYNRDNIFQGTIPQDKNILYIPIPLFAMYTFLMCLGIAFALVCLAFSLVFRNKLVVKNTLPVVNVCLCIGSILAYAIVLFMGIDENLTADASFACHCTIWLACFAFSLMFGSLLAKAWRIYFIYYNLKLYKTKKVPSMSVCGYCCTVHYAKFILLMYITYFQICLHLKFPVPPLHLSTCTITYLYIHLMTLCDDFHLDPLQCSISSILTFVLLYRMFTSSGFFWWCSFLLLLILYFFAL